MKTCFNASLVVCLCLLSACTNYQRFPESFQHSDSLIKAIKPGKKYTYWEYCSSDDPEKPIYFSGIKPADIKFTPPLFNGFFRGCMPSLCVNYINYIDNGKVGFVTDPASLQDFLGTIDNLEEAVLLAEVGEDISITDSDKGGSYYIQNDKFHLKLSRVSYCPETVESIYLCVQRDSGIVANKSLGIFHRTKDCIVF